MKKKAAETDKYLLGSALFLALLIGGGTASGLYTDTIIQIWTTIAAAVVISGPSEYKIDRRALWLLLVTFALGLAQVVPLPAELVDYFRPGIFADHEDTAAGGSRITFVSLGVGRTVECLLYMGAAAGFFLAVLKLRPEQVGGLVPFFFMGVLCNALAGVIQFALSDDVSIEGFLPFTITAGLFANVNHFSALLFITIPFVVFYGLFRGHVIFGALGVASILLLLLAAGSRAGVLIGLAITLISVFFMASRSRLGGFSLIVMFVAMSIYSIGAWTKIDTGALDPDFGRREFAETTISGIRENWLFGIGFGNFAKAYQIYEKNEMIFSEYVNHAHNEYLEIIFEGGIIAGFLILLYIAGLFYINFYSDSVPIKRAAFLSTLFILVHSFVDYPLRTMSIALSFAYMNAILFHSGFGTRVGKKSEYMEVEHNGEMLIVPIEAAR